MKLFKRSIWLITAALVIVPVAVFGLIHWYQNKFEQLPFYGATIIDAKGKKNVHQVENFEGTNQDGNIISLNKTNNKIIIANFFFTSCKGICPNMMSHVKKVQQALLNDTNITFLSFTVDPARDDDARLKWYAGEYKINNSNWQLLTGDKRQIYTLARKSFYLSAVDGDGADDDFIHSEQLVLVDSHKYIRGYYDGTDDHAIQQLIFDIKKLEHEY
jgi:protein SCO1/2